MDNEGGATSSNSLRRVFPSVGRLAVNMTFNSQEGVVLDQENRVFQQNDSLNLSAPCPGRCGNGEMDLAGKCQSMVNERTTQSQGRARCQQILMAGDSTVCGCELVCDIQITFLPEKIKESAPPQ